LIYIEKKTDITAPAVVTDIQPDKVITRLVSQSTEDGALMGEILWEKIDRKEFYNAREWKRFVMRTEKACREYGYSVAEMTELVSERGYHVFMHHSHRNSLDKKDWEEYFAEQKTPLEQAVRGMIPLCFVACLPAAMFVEYQ